MIRNIKTPHLPEGEVRHIIIGKKYRNLLENAIVLNNLEPIWLDNNPYVDDRLSGHTDLAAVHLSENHIIMSEYTRNCEVSDKLDALGYRIEYLDNPADVKYPLDVGLNVCIIGNRLICNPKTANSELIKKLSSYQKIAINQGYSKCAVCVVDECSIITSDKKTAKAAADAGMNVLYIEKPFVTLHGFEYGFIGGASFKINNNEIAFTGKITDRIIRNTIEAFLADRNVKPLYLTDFAIFDIGSAIPLTEEIP